MKNPMTLQEQHQALDDNDAGKPMQTLNFMDHSSEWVDRDPDFAGKDLSFDSLAYRRKPKTIERFAYVDGEISYVYKELKYAKAKKGNNSGDIYKLVVDPTWIDPEPEEMNNDLLTKEENELIEQGLEQIKLVDKYREALEIIAGIRPPFDNLMGNVDIAREVLKLQKLAPEEANPWRKIIKGEWPECKPADWILVKHNCNRIERIQAVIGTWINTTAIEWKYAENE